MMPSRLKRFYALALSIGLACVFLALSLVVPVIGTATDFSIYNTDWNGTSGLAVRTYQTGKFVPTLELKNTGASVEPAIIALDRVSLDPATSSMVIIGPSKAFSDADGDHVRQFLERGGKVLLADDFGTGNSLLARLGTTSRFTGSLVVDLAFLKKPEFAVAYEFDRTNDITYNVSLVLLNYPSAVSPGANASVLASTGAASWVDSDEDLYRDEDETSGPFAILTVERIGKGTLVLLSDPSILINSMYGQLDNSVLVDNLMAFVSEDRDAVLIDESHRSFFDPLSFSSKALAGVSDGAKLAFIVFIVIAFFLATTDAVSRTYTLLRRLSGKVWSIMTRWLVKEEGPKVDTFMNDDEILSKVLERHPGWNRGMLARLLRQIGRHGDVNR